MSNKGIVGKSSLAIAGANRATDRHPGMIGFSAVRMILLLAYVDPGSAGFIVTTVLGVLAAGGYLARASLNRLKRWVFRQNNEVELGKVASSTDDQADDR